MARDRFKKLGDSIPQRITPKELEFQYRDIIHTARICMDGLPEGKFRLEEPRDLEEWDNQR